MHMPNHYGSVFTYWPRPELAWKYRRVNRSQRVGWVMDLLCELHTEEPQWAEKMCVTEVSSHALQHETCKYTMTETHLCARRRKARLWRASSEWSSIVGLEACKHKRIVCFLCPGHCAGASIKNSGRLACWERYRQETWRTEGCSSLTPRRW